MHWTGLATIFALMSLDESMAFHEMMTKPIRELLDTSGLLYSAWVLPAIGFVLILSVTYSRFLFYLEARFRTQFIIAGGVYLLGVLGMEMVGGAYVSAKGYDMSYSILATVEEVLEMSGIVLFIAALLDYIEQHSTSLEILFEQ